jgi:hypothetical protein
MGEGTVLLGRYGDRVRLGIVYVSGFSPTGSLSYTEDWCGRTQSDPAKPSVQDSGAVWKYLGRSVNAYVLAFTLFYGTPPRDIADLSGTVANANPEAWNHPQVGPILRRISAVLVEAYRKGWTSRPPLGTLETA